MNRKRDSHKWLQNAILETLCENNFKLIIIRTDFETRREVNVFISQHSKPHIVLTNDEYVYFILQNILYISNLNHFLDPKQKSAEISYFLSIEWPIRPNPITYTKYVELHSLIHKIGTNRVLLSNLLSKLNKSDKRNLFLASPFINLKSKFLF